MPTRKINWKPSTAVTVSHPNVVNLYGFIRTHPLGVDNLENCFKLPDVVDFYGSIRAGLPLLVWTSSEEPVKVCQYDVGVHGAVFEDVHIKNEVDMLEDRSNHPNVVERYGFMRTPPVVVILQDCSKHPKVADSYGFVATCHSRVAMITTLG